MKLVIVESPTKTKSLTKYLGAGFEVMATVGHIRDLPKSKMGVEIKQTKKQAKTEKFKFKPEYVVVKGKGAVAKKLQQEAKKASEIILATDPDREGEAIAWHTAGVLGEKAKIGKDKFSRVVFHSVTKEAVLAAMEKPRKLDMDLVDAQQARRVLDRVVGYELSPVLWRKVRRGLSAGRVQSVALRLVVEKEAEIEAFKAEEYWKIAVEVKTEEAGESFWVELTKIGGKKAKVVDKKAADVVVAELKKAKFVVAEVIKKERKGYPKPPFKTSTMQQAAANILGWSAKRTMQAAQKLYEKGLITYHRTDSLALAEGAVAGIRDWVAKEHGEEYLPQTARYYKSGGKVVAQEAHEAVRPTSIKKVTLPGGGGEARLYGLIWARTVASQMAPALVDGSKIGVEAGKYGLEVKGEVVKFEGFRKVWGKASEDVVLPQVAVGQRLGRLKTNSEQKFSQPPARFNDASLIRELEKRGIGRPSTYAPTISTLLLRGYMERKDRRFFASKIGRVVVEFLLAHFGREMDYDFTAHLEEDLDEIARGKRDWNGVLSQFYVEFKPSVEKALDKAKRVIIPVEKMGKKCPECKKGDLVIREGRFGRFISCSRFPECKYSAPLIEYVEGAKCEKCGSRVVVKRTRKGREFYGCEKYPKCDWASWKRPKVEKNRSLEKTN